MSGRWREDDDEEFRVGGSRGAGGGGGTAGGRAKPRFSFTEVKLLLDEVKRNRYIILKKFNQGVSAEAKKQTWTEITELINDLGENHREVRQIMKKWADLKCDGKRRLVALRGPNGSNLRKKNLGPVERMVHKILLMAPGREVDSDLEWDEEEQDEGLKRRRHRGSTAPPPPPFSYLSMTDTNPLTLPGGTSFDLSPLSTPEKDLSRDPFHSSPDFDFDLPDDGERSLDFDDDEVMFSSHRGSFRPPSSYPLDPIADDPLLRTKPVHTYSRNTSKPPPGAAPSLFPSTSNLEPLSSSLAPTQIESNPSSSLAPRASSSPPLPPSYLSASSSSTSFPSNGSTSHPAPSGPIFPPSASSAFPLPPPPPPPPSAFPPPAPPSSSSIFPPPSSSHRSRPSSSSSSSLPPNRHTSSSSSSGYGSGGPLPPGASSMTTAREQVAHTAALSLQQQQASRVLLSSVSHSLETLAQSVQLLVESQQEFVQESLLLQREMVDVLRDFSGTTLTMLREKSNSAHNVPPQQP